MQYRKIVKAIFVSRPNRFIAHVNIEGQKIVVHVKNTGRCRELLLPGTVVYLEQSTNPARKTPYDLIAVEKVTPRGTILVNMDSQAPTRWRQNGLEQTSGVSQNCSWFALNTPSGTLGSISTSNSRAARCF